MRTFTPGTRESHSAWEYDAPEIRKLSTADGESTRNPTREELLRGEVWKLGAVFVELLTFLTLGTRGLLTFRKRITTSKGNITNDDIGNTPYDDGIKAKKEVFSWLKSLGKRDSRVAEMGPLMTLMLGLPESRPSMRTTVNWIRNVSGVRNRL